MRLFILIGAPGVGKTWICNKMSNDFNIISSDRLRNGIDAAVDQALLGEKPVLVDIPFRIKAFIERWRDKVPDAVVIALVEDRETHEQRLRLRGGEFDATIIKRVKRIDSLSKRYANIIGDSDHVLKRLTYEAVKERLGDVPDDKMVVYRATSPSGKSYIGQTRHGFRHRVWRHYYSAIVGNESYPFMTALSKYKDQFKWEILAKCDDQESLNSEEIRLIQELKTNNPDFGYNCTKGGPGWSGMKLADTHPFKAIENKSRVAWNRGRKGVQPPMSDEHKQKIIAANTGRVPSELHLQRLAERNASGWQSDPEIRKKISESNKGMKLTPEQLAKLSEATKGKLNGMYGKNHSEETKAKMSEAKKVLLVDPDFKSKFRESRSKFKIVSPDGEIFMNDRDAAAKTGISRNKIRKMIEDPNSGWYRVAKS